MLLRHVHGDPRVSPDEYQYGARKENSDDTTDGALRLRRRPLLRRSLASAPLASLSTVYKRLTRVRARYGAPGPPAWCLVGEIGTVAGPLVLYHARFVPNTAVSGRTQAHAFNSASNSA